MSTKKKIELIPKRLSTATQSKAKNDPEYEKDFYKWVNNQANLLKKKEFTKLDIDNLIEEIESLGKSEKRMLKSYLEVLLMHMLKIRHQPGMHTTSWDLSIKEAGYKVQKTLKENPSLKAKLKEIVEEAYFSARLKAALETKLDENVFEEKCPWTFKEIFSNLEEKYLS